MGQSIYGNSPYGPSPYGDYGTSGSVGPNGSTQDTYTQSLSNAYAYRQRHSPSQDKILPDTELVMNRLHRGVMGAEQWKAVCQIGQQAQVPIQYGEYTDLIRPRLNSIGYLSSFTGTGEAASNGLNMGQFVHAFGLQGFHPTQVAQIMGAVDAVDGVRHCLPGQEPTVSVEDAMPMLGYFDSGAYGQRPASQPGQPGQPSSQFDMTITPAERYDAQVGLWQALQGQQLPQLAASLRQSYRGFYQSE